MTTEQEKHRLDIEAMIMGENDPSQRAFLVVLNSINLSLIANTSTIQDVSQKLETHLLNFETHAANEEAVMNQGRGAWKIAAWVLGIAQLIGTGLWYQSRDDLAATHREMAALIAVDSSHSTRITVLETLKGK